MQKNYLVKGSNKRPHDSGVGMLSCRDNAISAVQPLQPLSGGVGSRVGNEVFSQVLTEAVIHVSIQTLLFLLVDGGKVTGDSYSLLLFDHHALRACTPYRPQPRLPCPALTPPRCQVQGHQGFR
jgi:hypothetical protein